MKKQFFLSSITLFLAAFSNFCMESGKKEKEQFSGFQETILNHMNDNQLRDLMTTVARIKTDENSLDKEVIKELSEIEKLLIDELENRKNKKKIKNFLRYVSVKKHFFLFCVFLLSIKQTSNGMGESFSLEGSIDLPPGNIYPLMEANETVVQILNDFNLQYEQFNKKELYSQPEVRTKILEEMMWIAADLMQNSIDLDSAHYIEKLRKSYQLLGPAEQDKLKKNTYGICIDEMSDSELEESDPNAKIRKSSCKRYDNHAEQEKLEQLMVGWQVKSELIQKQIEGLQEQHNYLDQKINEIKSVYKKRTQANKYLIHKETHIFNKLKENLINKQEELKIAQDRLLSDVSFNRKYGCQGNVPKQQELVSKLEREIEELRWRTNRAKKRIASTTYLNSDYLLPFLALAKK